MKHEIKVGDRVAYLSIYGWRVGRVEKIRPAGPEYCDSAPRAEVVFTNDRTSGGDRRTTSVENLVPIRAFLDRQFPDGRLSEVGRKNFGLTLEDLTAAGWIENGANGWRRDPTAPSLPVYDGADPGLVAVVEAMTKQRQAEKQSAERMTAAEWESRRRRERVLQLAELGAEEITHAQYRIHGRPVDTGDLHEVLALVYGLAAFSNFGKGGES